MFAYDSIQNILAISTLDGRIKLFGRDNTQALLHSQEALPSKFLQFIPNQGVLLNVTVKNHIEVSNSTRYYSTSISWNSSEVSAETAVVHALPQPTAESKRILIIFRDGIISLWEIRESKSIYTAGGNLVQSLHQETKKVTSACWTSKVAVGFCNGELLIWSIPTTTDPRTESVSDSVQSSPIFKLNLGYKVEKIPIASLKWAHAEGNASRLYVMGASDLASTNSQQVVLLNEHIETRTIKVRLHSPEPCIDMEVISSSRLYLSVTKRIPPLMPLETKQNDEAYLKSIQFSGFSRVKNLYITGHSDGAISFWDASCPFFTPILSVKQQVSSNRDKGSTTVEQPDEKGSAVDQIKKKYGFDSSSVSTVA
ncbi:Transducin/WD40 repeat-like superfamily protein isoform 3 [Tripterygium wilfordii]|uniref:Transducin/WD40 repeat-like superfamily protein isoform 3 n=1 Tax=Tripterygium wilfordii TaxID=458696 RepID=A0A7J7E3C7_TRIWF|nr:Transducin/WD40 repeat-like superfamily protein isoform 3 [Tripterygium wilfordii]